MAAPTSAVPTRAGRRILISIPAQTATFDYPFSNKGAYAITIQMSGTIGSATTSLQAGNDNAIFADVALLQGNVIAHTELKALTIALSPYSMRLEDLGYAYYNLHHVAGGGSSVAFVISIVEA